MIEFAIRKEYDSEDKKPYSLHVQAKQNGRLVMNQYLQFESLEEFNSAKGKMLSEIRKCGGRVLNEETNDNPDHRHDQCDF